MDVFNFINDIINPQQKWEKIVKKNEWKLRKVPLEYLTQKMCNEAVKKNPKTLTDVPDQFKTQEMCDKAVEEVPSMLEYVPEQFKTREMSFKAVEKDIEMSEYVCEGCFDEDNDCWDSDFAELLKCKGDDGECKENCLNDGRNCFNCNKVICYGHTRNCCWCNRNPADCDMVYCEDCSYKITAYVCNRH